MNSRAAFPVTALALLLMWAPLLSGATEPGKLPASNPDHPGNQDQRQQALELFQQLPPLAHYYAGIREADADTRLRRETNYQEFWREKLAGQWFAALVADTEQEPNTVKGRFDTWGGLADFLAERDALVEVWAYGEAGQGKPRRLTALELAKIKQQRSEPPTYITATYRDAPSGQVVCYRVEFGFQAAATVLAQQQAYLRHRQVQLSAQEILSARNAKGLVDSQVQWESLRAAVQENRFPMLELPPRPLNQFDPFIAFEFEVDHQNNIQQAVRVYRDSEVRKEIIEGTQRLFLRKTGEKKGRETVAFRRRGMGDQLEPVMNPLPGQDIVELRLREVTQADPRRWHLVEFGEPEVLKQSALAHFSLLHAYLEKHRKSVAMKKANLALIVEPLIAGLNVGGGLAGLGFPAGDCGRLVYNLIVWRMIAEVPSVRQMRELFALMAARAKDPLGRVKPAEYLSRADVESLKRAGKKLSNAEVQAYLERMSDEDIRAMLKLARMGRLDERVTTFLNLLTSVFKVSGLSDEPGALKDIFNNVRFSLNGDINLKTILALALGKDVLTPYSGTSLEALSHGEGPSEAWWQFFEVSVDVRAVINTLVRVFKTTEAKKELEKPFPYAPRLSDLSAYEVRVFGFPLLMFYKRGLVKADYQAYQNDYAYGIHGTKVVEHFRSREEFEAEIRARRVVPLGYVRVMAGKAGWKDTDLAVFAHRVPRGKHRGKTTLIIYGLKAYIEHSDLIARELKRFQDYEQGLREGAVIEQQVPADLNRGFASLTYEPVIHLGTNAVEEIYRPLLAGLIELRRYSLRKAWGLAADPEEQDQIRAIRDRLAARDIQVGADNPLVGIDQYGSSFIYRRQVQGQEREVKVTSIPSLEDIQRELSKAEEARAIEEIRRDAAAGKNQGVVLLNEVLEDKGRREIGPLLRGRKGGIMGAGVASGAKALEEIFELIDRLPVTDRARLRFNHFGATVVELDPEKTGAKKAVFLTLEFPLGELRREWTNPLTGERETLVFVNGLWRQTITDRRIVELDYNGSKIETNSRTYFNKGDRQTPLPGELLEETRTLDLWHRDLSQPDLDPYEPTISKLRVNEVTGQVTRETYGLFSLPVETADDQFITRYQYNPYGILAFAQARENGQAEADFQRPLLEKVLRPLAGRERFQWRSQQANLSELRDLSGSDYRMVLERLDLVKKTARIEVISQAHFGRKIQESYVDAFDGTRSFSSTLTHEYRDDFYYGLMPARSMTASATPGTPLSEVAIIRYDPVRRRLTGVETDYTGKVRTNTWDYRWTNPVEVETGQRLTLMDYGRDETTVKGTTLIKSTGEMAGSFSGQYDPVSRTWSVTQQAWHRPGVLNRTETNTYSALGKLIAARIGGTFERRPAYAPDGREQATETWRWNPVTGRFDIPHRREDDYRWQQGARDARVKTYLEGVAYDEYRILIDSEGRTVVDGLHPWPQIDLKTVLTYEGDSDRLLKAEVWQHGEVRTTRWVLGESDPGEGGRRLRVRVTPYWGLVSTNTYLVGDSLGRPVAATYENGDQVKVLEWYADTAEAKVSELIDRRGHPKERLVKRPNAGIEVGLPYDLVVQHRLNPWGDAVFLAENALVRGTEVALFKDMLGSRIYSDLAQRYDSPSHEVDLAGHFGLRTIIAGRGQPKVTAVDCGRFNNWRDPLDTNRLAERVLEVTRVDLTGLFYHKFSRRIYDRTGNLLEERTGKIDNLSPRTYSDHAIFAEVDQAPLTRKFLYRYEPGWLIEQAESKTGQVSLSFTNNEAGDRWRQWRVNEAGDRQWPTELQGHQAAIESQLGIADIDQYLFRRMYAPRMLRDNPHLPGLTNVWMEWRSAELDDSGKVLFDSQIIYDASGQPSTAWARKINSFGQPSEKLLYTLPYPDPDSWRAVTLTESDQGLPLDLEGQEDLSACDFIAFYLDAPEASGVILQARDKAGHEVMVASQANRGGTHALAFWPSDRSQIQWLPNAFVPERGSVAGAPLAWVADRKVFMVSIPVLSKAGLEVRRMAALNVKLAGQPAGPIRISPLYRLAHRGAFLSPTETQRFEYEKVLHSTGLETVARAKTPRTAKELRTHSGESSLLKYHGAVIGSVNFRPWPPYYPMAFLIDNAEPELSRPLYALAAEDGKFLEYYQTLQTGDTQVYSVVSGFETPKLEVYRAQVLDDEISPGMLAFGHGYYVTIPLLKTVGKLSKAIATLHNRCVASAFTLGGDRFLDFVFDVVPRKTEFRRLSKELDLASVQAEDINQLPTLARVLLPLREVPWAQTRSGLAANTGWSGSTNRLRDYLRLLSLPYPKTQLIPTVLGSELERYVDTEQEAALIELAVKLNEPSLASELLSFYWEKSQGGTNKLPAFFDAKTGASLVKKPGYKRPVDASTPAGAQLAMAQAAFCLGVATGDRNAMQFGKNLVDLVLDKYRPSLQDTAWPRGIAEFSGSGAIIRHGVTLWPKARSFALKSNARAYLLFKRLEDIPPGQVLDPDWKQTVAEAAREQAAWLTQRIIPYVQETGVAPRGLFEIQDVHNKTTALAAEPWTSADDWLTLIEAADRLGISRQLTWSWLDNLACVHGVTVQDAWGLDWSVPLQRPDAISTELTAKLIRVANLLDYRQAADFAQDNLDRMCQGNQWPVVVTAARADEPLKTGQGHAIYPVGRVSVGSGLSALTGWPQTLIVLAEQAGAAWPTHLQAGKALEPRPTPAPDLTQFLWTAAGFYLAVVAASLFWWWLSAVRKRRRDNSVANPPLEPLVSDGVMQQAEERWAKRVFGLCSPPSAERSRYANGPVEQNFFMQLRAMYKLVIEWRRLANGWSENDGHLVEVVSDGWLNGLDEFAVMVGIYSRWVVKAGEKDGLRRENVLEEHEDSNHIWSRLVTYLSESHFRLLGLVAELKANSSTAAEGIHQQIEQMLQNTGMRMRSEPFDARLAFDVPHRSSALDLLMIQLPQARLSQIVKEMDVKLGIPREQVVSFLKNFKEFKEREQLYPVHPYLLEAAKMLPHFLLLGLVGLIWHNYDAGGIRIYPFLKDLAFEFAFDGYSLTWAIPLLAGYVLTAAALFLKAYPYFGKVILPSTPQMALDISVTRFLRRQDFAEKAAPRVFQWLNPRVIQFAGWWLRAFGLVWLARTLLREEMPSFATFMFVKGLVAMILLTEAGGILAPMAVSRFSRWLEDRVASGLSGWGLARFVNQLNLVPTQPASLLWLSFKYHFQPSVPTGGPLSMFQSIVFYLGFSAVFFVVGSYMYKQALEVWFQEVYRNGWNLGLIAGALVFWNTMYLLRFGLFVLFATTSSALAVYPFRVLGGLIALVCLVLPLFDSSISGVFGSYSVLSCGLLLGGLAIMAFEEEALAWLASSPLLRRRAARRQAKERQAWDPLKQKQNPVLGVVYMSGDDLSFYKLTPGLLMKRVSILRNQLGSGGFQLLSQARLLPEDDVLAQWFASLYELELKCKATLWHPMQVVVAGEPPHLRAELGLNLIVENDRQREQILSAWHVRRWLVTMMSTAGHSQDTGINLADIALRLAQEGLGAHTVFYLLQNKYDNQDNNRPSQLDYSQGELGQRNKLARLLMELAPGSRAYNVNDWTPFGFKAGGLVGMDLVYEESLRLTNMLVLDRNAHVYDLDALMTDLKLALGDPGVVMIIPGRSTTNTLTPIGQGSQLIEEGQRAFTRGVMMLGGGGAEMLGTGWGNIQAVFYGRVQQALCNPHAPLMPLTMQTRRGTSFGDRCEGLIGFGPHAVGISEDIWGAVQAAHNALGLGFQVKFRRSQALWHKMRESWSHAEWFSAFPRWSGGYLQMMLDPLMQKINDGGPWSVFAKEIRANGGRFFLSAPSAFLSILLMPLAIIWDVSPFVQILILLWNLGFIMNQVLTPLGLVACLESTGFKRVPAVIGAVLSGIIAATQDALAPFALALMVWGFLAGGFALGLGRWLFYRGRDMILFGPQLVIHALGQVVRQTLEFVLSGALPNDAAGVNIAFRAWVGPREDSPGERYQHLVNLRSVVWGVGLLSLMLNLFALANLDFLNVLLLLPSLMFSVSTLIGPFIMQPKPGPHPGSAVWAPKFLGWTASFGFYALVAWLIAQGRWSAWMGVLLFAACFGCILRSGLRYFGYSRKLRRIMAVLTRRLTDSGLPNEAAQKLTRQLARTPILEAEKMKAMLQAAALTSDQQEAVLKLIQDQLTPWLRKPVADLHKNRFTNRRFVVEFNRSFLLGLFTFIWFFVVPIPGLLVFALPGGYRISLPLAGVLLTAASAIGLVLAGLCVTLFLERQEIKGFRGQGLSGRFAEQFRRFQSSLRQPSSLTSVQIASVFALFTGAQTYFDKRSYGYFRRTLDSIEKKLAKYI